MCSKAHYFILLSGLLVAGCTSFNSSKKNYIYQEVHYVTTRENTQSEDPDKTYSGNRGELRYGISMVAIDPVETFTSFAQAQPNVHLQQTQLLQSKPLQQIREFSKSEFLESMDNYAKEPGTVPEVLIYIHGYKKSFSRTVSIAAQMRYELAFPGPVIGFAWPSKNTVSGYVVDLENLDWSEPEFESLLETIAQEWPEAKIHVIAHSLGNKAFIKTLLQMWQSRTDKSNWPIGEIVLIAPDVDRAIFIEDTALQLKEIPSRKTLYVSGKDFPLFASATVYQYPRLGDSRDGPPIIEGIDTVDVSDAVPLFDGHGYYEANKETIEDLYHLIRMGLSPGDRPTLQEVDVEEGTYWRLKPRD